MLVLDRLPNDLQPDTTRGAKHNKFHRALQGFEAASKGAEGKSSRLMERVT